MNKIQKRIEIVRARDTRFSSMGLKSGAMIQKVLSNYYQYVNLCSVKDSADLAALVARQPDLVILGLKRLEDAGEKIWLSEYLDSKGINYTGSNQAAMELDLNKASAKTLMQENGIPTADFFTAEPNQYLHRRQLPLKFPLFVKPHDQGGGMGIGPDSIVHDFPSFQKKVASIFEDYRTFSLIEEYLEGREFSVALMGSGYDDDLIAMPIELITTPNEFGDRILGQDVKAEDNERAVAIQDKAVHVQLADLAKSIYKVLGGRDYGRIDLRMDSAGKAYFIEANLTPGIANNDFVSYFMRACELNEGMSYQDTILNLVDIALQRDNVDVSGPIDLLLVPVLV